jgi:hypothetical protein
MKKLFLLFNIFFILTFTVFSQPILNYNSFPQVGDTFVYYSLSSGQSLLPGNSGADITWDFSALDTSNLPPPSTLHYSTPANTPYGNSFPNSNLAKVYSSAQIEYYNKNNDSVSYLGHYIAGTTRFYHDPQIQIKFPGNFQYTFTDNYASNFNHNGNAVSRTGTVSVTIDGYGTLILPGRTIPNTSRIRTVKTTKDVSGGTINYTDTLYHWYSPHLRDYVLYYYVTVYQGTTYSHGRLMHSDHITNIESIGIAKDVRLFPNPAKNSINLELPGQNNEYTVEIFTLQGRMIQSIELKNAISSIDVSELSRGVYLMKVIGSEEIFTKKFIVN